MHKQ